MANEIKIQHLDRYKFKPQRLIESNMEGKLWSAEDDNLLQSLTAEKRSIEYIAGELGRTVKSCCKRRQEEFNK